jgi:hypothetical protein
MENSMGHIEGTIQQYCARTKMTRGLHPVYSPNLPPWDFWLVGDAKEKMKDQTIKRADRGLGKAEYRPPSISVP